MAERQRRKISLTSILRCTYTKHICHKPRQHTSPSSNSTMQSRSTSMSARKDPNISSSNPTPSRSIRNISAPQYHRFLYALDKAKPESDHEDQGENELKAPHNGRSMQVSRETKTKTLQVRRLAPRLNPLHGFPHTEPTVSLTRRTILTSSRIPSPTGPPKGKLYSHSMYKKEGRRSVLSPLGRRGMASFLNPPKSQSIENTTEILSIQSEHAAHERLNRPSLLLRRSSVHYGNSNGLLSVQISAGAPAPAHIRKERAKPEDTTSSDLLMPRYYQIGNRLSSFQITPPETAGNMPSPRRVRLAKGLENLKTAQESQPTKLPVPKQRRKSSLINLPSLNPKSRQQTEFYGQENNVPAAYVPSQHEPPILPSRTDGDVGTAKSATGSSSKPPPENTSSHRRKVQIEKMVSIPRPTQTPRYHYPISTRNPSRLSHPNRKTVLIPPLCSKLQVETAMPEVYWLGRFMTLTNVFHYEDSFNEPDIATGFEMPSSYSRPFQGSDDGDTTGYRVKRAFMVLENLCVTEEASSSLREFRNGYIRRFGDKWMA